MTMADMSATAADHPAHEEAYAAPSMAKAMRQPLFPAPTRPVTFSDSLPVKISFEGVQVLQSAFLRFTGAVLILCAPGLWLLPGSNVDPALMLYKLGASIFFLFCGTALILRNKSLAQPEVYFDPIRREMRILQKNAEGRPQTVLRRSYDTLGKAKIGKRQLEIWDVDGSVLVSIPLTDDDARDALRYQLGDLAR